MDIGLVSGKQFAPTPDVLHPVLMSLKLKYWGVRGSLPASPTPEQWVRDVQSLFVEFFETGHKGAADISKFFQSKTITSIGGFGTGTTCVEVLSPKAQIIIDGGSGMRNLSEAMMKLANPRSKKVIHIFLTHFHWDHLIGLPFFAPHFIAGNVIHYYAVQPELESLIRGKFRKPYFPVPYEALPATIHFHQLQPRKPLMIEDMSITPYQLDHPDPCWGFRIESGGKSYAHCVDSEGTRISRESLGPDLPLYQNADLMYFDAQYTLPELAEKANWGHSAAQLGLDLAFRENIKRVIFAHHDPGANTQQLNNLQKQTREYHDWYVKTAETNHRTVPEVEWQYAFEGMEIDL